jgi:hypothetical protein
MQYPGRSALRQGRDAEDEATASSLPNSRGVQCQGGRTQGEVDLRTTEDCFPQWAGNLSKIRPLSERALL